MSEARVAFQDGTSPANTNFPWASTASGATSVSLTDVSGSGWGYTRTASSTVSQATAGPSSITVPAADWVDEIVIAEQSMWTDVDVAHEWSGLDDTKTYAFELFGARLDSGANRSIDVSTDPAFGTFVTLETDGNTSETVLLTGLSPTSGVITLYTRQSASATSPFHVNAVRLYEEVASADYTQRKGSTFDVTHGLGAITTATLNSVNVFDHLTGQVGTTVSFSGAATDEITTSGQYTLTLGDGVGTEDITVQVNVVGLPTNTAKKDGGLLTSLADLTLDAVNSSGTVVEQLTGITTDASGIISAIDLSHISEAIGDTLKVSLHSAAADVGVTFEQALEAI